MSHDPKREAIPIADYLASLDKPGGFRETKEILESIPHDPRLGTRRTPPLNASVVLRKSHYINGNPELEIWICGMLLTVDAQHIRGDIAPFYEG